MTPRTILAAILPLLVACNGSITDDRAGSGGGGGVGGDDTATSCKADGDCVAPAICRVCDDGSPSCAAGKCVEGACQVVYPPCPGPDDDALCPAEAPAAGDSCSGLLHCSYGTETCCGQTYASMVCDCTSGTFACFWTDACFMPPDGCDPEPQVECGGLANIACPGSGECVYPSEGCLACNGLCECNQTLECLGGSVFDASPSVCACVAAGQD